MRLEDVLDGGLATALQAVGLPPFTPVEEWVLSRPDDVERAQRAFADAGARILLTATFRAHLRPDAAEVADRAVAIARRAGRGAVWASIGPGPGGAELARRCDVDGYALETFVSADEALAAVAAVRAVTDRPIVACLVPGPDGRLLDGAEPAPALRALRGAGATFVGFNCAEPRAIEAAITRAPEADWAKPSAGEDLVPALLRLAARCRFVGGCCGVGPDAIGAIARARRA